MFVCLPVSSLASSPVCLVACPHALIELGLPRLNPGPAFLRLRKALSKPRTVVRSDDRFLTYFGKLNREQGIALLNDMMARGPSNMQVCVKVAKKYNEELRSEELVKAFKNANATEGLYYYLGAVVNFLEAPIVHFK